jgi:hypothetical protein
VVKRKRVSVGWRGGIDKSGYVVV